MKRQKVRVNQWHKDGIYGSLIGSECEADRLVRVIAYLTDVLNAIPAEYRDTARLEIDSVGGYGGEHHAEVAVYYERPETDEELAERKAEAKASKAAEEERERRTLAALQAKYAK